MNTAKLTIRSRYRLPVLILGSWFLVLSGCSDADRFYDTLNALPQINNSTAYAYNNTYLVGDTMVITGRLYPQNNLQITIGGVAARMVKTDSIAYYYSVAEDKRDTAYMDQVSLLIEEAMAGKSREVKVLSGGYSTLGNPVNIYSTGGAASISDTLKAVSIYSFSNSAAVMFHYRSGKGDSYYYSPDNGQIMHLSKDGVEEVVYTLSGSLPLLGNETVASFLAGGVDPLGNFLYFSVQTGSATYWLVKLDIASGEAEVMNRSAGLSAPYEGDISTVQTIVTGIYPDSTGNLYVALGGSLATVGNYLVPDAIAAYSAANGKLSYLYKRNNTAGMPGSYLKFLSSYFSPDENLLYITRGGSGITTGIDMYDLDARTLVKSVNLPGGSNPYQVVGEFSQLQILVDYLDGSYSNCFGYLPLPGMRLLALLYHNNTTAAARGFPKWVVFDFDEERTYLYAPGQFDLSSFTFLVRPTRDRLLNTDEDGNIYMTSTGNTYMIKTQYVKE